MRHTAVVRDPLAEARDRFLAADPVDAKAVREPILASWWRSREWHVAADRLDLSYLGEPDLDSALARAAKPVLRHLHEQLEGQPISIVLTDASGLVLLRFTGDHDLERQLDTIKLAPGFSYAEDVVGTNGIGTALESGGPAHVFGHEHYAERLEGLACAGVPVRDPMSGKTVGVLDLTCWRRHADPLMLSLVRSTADQLNQALSETSNGRDLRLLQEYTQGLPAHRRHRPRARQRRGHAQRPRPAGAVAGRPGGADLPGGRRARTAGVGRGHGRPAERRGGPDILPPGVARGRRGPRQAGRGRGRHAGRGGAAAGVDGAARPGRLGPDLAARLPVGRGQLRPRRVAHLRGRGRHGQARPRPRRPPAARPGRAVPRARRGRRRRDHDWLGRARDELLNGTGLLIIRHVHALNTRQVRALAAALGEAKAAGKEATLRVAVTLDRDAARADLTGLLRLFPGTVTVPPLRHHSEDLRELIPFFLGRLSQQGRVSCSPAAMQLLLRHTWPGNAAQLWQVLKQVVQRRRTGQIMPADLPPECWTVSRRVLSPLESIERDAIVQSLLDHGGNKIRAARALGMSRATIYRRIHEYGIVTPKGG